MKCFGFQTAAWITVAMFCVTPATLSAQVSPDEAVRQILESIDEELAEIDRMLDQTRDQRPTAAGADSADSGASTETFRKLLKETEGSQERVVRGIDNLIEQLQSMQQQSGSSSSKDGEKDQQPQNSERSSDPLQNQEDSQRSESQQPQNTEGLRKEPQQEGQQKPEDKPGEDGKPSSQKDPKGGKNRQTGSTTDDGEETVVRESDRVRWGNLQKYDLHKHIRGGAPEVPEKYRRFLEAYQRANQRSRGGR